MVEPPDLTEEQQKAYRLARAIASDISLYHEHLLAFARSRGRVRQLLAPVLDEGRQLYELRTPPDLHPYFGVLVDGVLFARHPPEGPLLPPPISDPGEAQSFARALLLDALFGDVLGPLMSDPNFMRLVGEEGGRIRACKDIFDASTSPAVRGQFAAVVESFLVGDLLRRLRATVEAFCEEHAPGARD